MKTPIELLLDGVQWQEVSQRDDNTDGLPWVTHEGVLEIAGAKLRCYRLNTGQAIFDADDVQDYIGGMLSE